VIENRESICLRPDSEKCRFIQYREAWGLMKPTPLSALELSASPNRRKLRPQSENLRHLAHKSRSPSLRTCATLAHKDARCTDALCVCPNEFALKKPQARQLARHIACQLLVTFQRGGMECP